MFRIFVAPGPRSGFLFLFFFFFSLAAMTQISGANANTGFVRCSNINGHYWQAMWALGSLLASRHCRIRLILQIPFSSYLHNLCKYVFSFLQSSIPLLVSPPARHRMMLMIAQPAKILAGLNEVKIFFAELSRGTSAFRSPDVVCRMAMIWDLFSLFCF